MKRREAVTGAGRRQNSEEEGGRGRVFTRLDLMGCFHLSVPLGWGELMFFHLHTKSHRTHMHSRVPSSSGHWLSLSQVLDTHTPVLQGPGLTTSRPSSVGLPLLGLHSLELSFLATCHRDTNLQAQCSRLPSSLSGRWPSSFSARWLFQLFI